jgi:hypothetical protein
MSDQSHLDADVQALTAAFTAIGDEITSLKDAQASGQPLDFTKLDAAVAAAQGLAPPTPPPATA